MPADQPTPERLPSRLKVVPLHDRSGVTSRLAADPSAAVAWFRPIVDIRRGEAAGYEVVFAIDGGDPQAPRAWSSDVHPRQAGAVEAPLLAAALAVRERVPSGCFLAVSLSAHGVLSGPVGQLLASAGRLERVVLVVTDDSQGADPHAVRQVLDKARDAGATVAVDETAAGYASLRQVLSLRPDFVRIGGDFVVEIDRDHAKAAVVETLAALASRIDSSVIASGIVGSGELDTLRRLGVSLGQGPLFGRPLPRMGPIEGRVARLIEQAPPLPGGEPTVAPLVEARPPVAWGAPIEELADAFLDDPRHDVVVLVDEQSRPLALADRAALLRGEPYERPVMRITPSSPLKAVARRAAARPVLERHHPLVACDRRGVYLGVVRVEQLLDALAR